MEMIKGLPVVGTNTSPWFGEKFILAAYNLDDDEVVLPGGSITKSSDFEPDIEQINNLKQYFIDHGL